MIYYCSPKPLFISITLFCSTGMLHAQSSSAKIDIGFVLRGFGGSSQFDSTTFEPYAKEIVDRLNVLSFGNVTSYKIYSCGIDDRSPKYLQGLADIETLQASLDGWPGSKWDWLRNRTDFWYVVPANYRPIIANAIIWIRDNQKSFSDWRLLTAEGIAHGSLIQDNVIRMGPSSASDYLKGMKLPVGYDPNDFKSTFVILNSNTSETIAGAGAQSALQFFGVVKSDGTPLPSSEANRALYVFASDQTLNGSSSFFYTSIHEGIHVFGMGTHDQDPQSLNTAYSIMASNGASESINTLPAWDRYFWNKWLPKSTITTNPAAVSDLKGKGKPSDSTLKYILQVVAGDDRGCGGTYKELYDGKWYTYKVDAGGTLTFTEGIKNDNRSSPKLVINPFNHQVIRGNRIVLRSVFSGEPQINYVWKKNGVVLAGQNLNYLSFNSVQLSDTGSYTVIASNAFGSDSTTPVKLSVANCAYPVTIKVSNIASVNVCLKDSVQLSLGVSSGVQWYKDGNAINGATATSYWVKNSGLYSAKITYPNACSADVQGVRIYPLPEKPVFNTSRFAFCSGDSLRLSVTNVNKGDTLKWYFGTQSDLSNVVNKTFKDTVRLYVTRTDSIGCLKASDTVQILKFPIPPAPTIMKDADNSLVASSYGTTWYKDGVKLTDTTQKIKPAISGTYAATTTWNGCTSSMSAGYSYIATGIAILSAGEYIHLYPNPTAGVVTIDFSLRSSKNVTLSIYDLSGRSLLDDKKLVSGDQINIGRQPKGAYMILVTDVKGRVVLSRQVVKN